MADAGQLEALKTKPAKKQSLVKNIKPRVSIKEKERNIRNSDAPLFVKLAAINRLRGQGGWQG